MREEFANSLGLFYLRVQIVITGDLLENAFAFTVNSWFIVPEMGLDSGASAIAFGYIAASLTCVLRRCAAWFVTTRTVEAVLTRIGGTENPLVVCVTQRFSIPRLT